MSPLLDRPDRGLLVAATGLLAASLAVGMVAPPLFGLLLTTSVIAGIVFLAFCFPIGFCIGWLLITGMSLEMAVNDWVGAEAYQPTIAALKGAEIGLGLLCMLRYGPRLDPLCPAWAYPVMLAQGFVHGLYPGLSAMDSLRSMIGSMTPFIFSFCRMPVRWADAIIRTTQWCAVAAVVACLPLSAVDLRPLFIDSGGMRLAGLGHPAFLAGVCLPAIYACLITLFRTGRRGDLLLLLVNIVILVLTGARAPFVYAMVVTVVSLVSIRSSTFAAANRLLLVLAAAALLPVLVLLAGDLNEIRLFNVMLNQTDNLSGRDLLWPTFQQAAAESPWVGWGTGAGNVVIPQDGRIVQILHTWAAHNEYLRIEVEGGALGEALLVAMFVAWIVVRTRALRPADRRIMRLAFLAFACHAFTDNVLISTPACVLFVFASAVFARPVPE